MKPNYETLGLKAITINELLDQIRKDLSNKKTQKYLETGPCDTVYIDGYPYRSAPV
ncbi:hypothetical protein HYY71_07340 [Candidatus Woesearchaeota archaeon]|nr:hypothetical protein [Candidatus Woesearchaeota archaeon]